MSALTITARQAIAAGACEERFMVMERHVGSVEAFGIDTPMPLTTVLDVAGVGDALWCLGAIGERRRMVDWACDCVERVPHDDVGREAIRVARLCARGLASQNTAWSAFNAAMASRAAAWTRVG